MKVITAVAAKHGFALPAFSYLLDHAHVVASGLSPTSNLERFVAEWKQATGYQWGQRCDGKLWQPGYWDSLLVDDVSLDRAITYVVMNPVRAGLADSPDAYALTGSTLYKLEELARRFGTATPTIM